MEEEDDVIIALTQISINTWEHSSVRVANGPKGSEAVQTDQTGWANWSYRFSRVSPESVISRDNYHAYMVKDDDVYKQTSKG